MNHKRPLPRMIAMAIVLLVLAACGAPQSTPTLTQVPPTATPTLEAPQWGQIKGVLVDKDTGQPILSEPRLGHSYDGLETAAELAECLELGDQIALEIDGRGAFLFTHVLPCPHHQYTIFAPAGYRFVVYPPPLTISPGQVVDLGEIKLSPEMALQPTSIPTSTPVHPTPGPPAVGSSCSDPFPITQVLSVPHWDVQVVEVLRGQEAWTAVKEADASNDPPPNGMEYLLVKMHAKYTGNDSFTLDDAISGISFSVTGDRLLEYRRARNSAVEPRDPSAYPDWENLVVVPDPIYGADFSADGETEGWVGYLIGEGEGNLMLVFRSYMEEYVRYIALDEGASITVSDELMDIEPTGSGREISDPARLQDTVVTEDWEFTLLQVAHGEEAWAIAQRVDQLNYQPTEGIDYSAVRVHLRYIGTKDRSQQVGTGDFSVVPASWDMDDWGFFSTITFDFIFEDPVAILYPGGEFTGWVVLEAWEDEEGSVLAFKLWPEPGTIFVLLE